jgi:hypothetical protein
MTQRQVDAAGMIGGLIVAAVFLIAVSIALLQPEGTSAKVLIAVWLWALPVIGIGMTLGYGVAKLVGRMRGAR